MRDHPNYRPEDFPPVVYPYERTEETRKTDQQLAFLRGLGLTQPQATLARTIFLAQHGKRGVMLTNEQKKKALLEIAEWVKSGKFGAEIRKQEQKKMARRLAGPDY